MNHNKVIKIKIIIYLPNAPILTKKSLKNILIKVLYQSKWHFSFQWNLYCRDCGMDCYLQPFYICQDKGPGSQPFLKMDLPPTRETILLNIILTTQPPLTLCTHLPYCRSSSLSADIFYVLRLHRNLKRTDLAEHEI